MCVCRSGICNLNCLQRLRCPSRRRTMSCSAHSGLLLRHGHRRPSLHVSLRLALTGAGAPPPTLQRLVRGGACAMDEAALDRAVRSPFMAYQWNGRRDREHLWCA